MSASLMNLRQVVISGTRFHDHPIFSFLCYLSSLCVSKVREKSLRGLAGFLAAVFTDAIDLEVVTGSVKMIFAANFFFQLAHLRGEKLNGRAALRADHVMMAAPVELMLIAGHAVWEWNSAGQAAFRQQLERTVDRGKADLRVFFSDQAKQLVCGKMIARLQKDAQDGVTLVSMFQANTP